MFSGFRTIDNNVVNHINLIQREFESAFNQASKNTNHKARIGSMYPPVNVISTNDSFEVALFVSNLKADAIDITVDDNVLVIEADRENNAPKEAKPLIKERVDGRVSRRIVLPKDCDSENIVADYKLGVLTVKIAKREKAKPIKVQIH